MLIITLFFIQQNPLIQEMVNKVSPDTIISTIQRLQDFVTRYAPYDSCFAAANWIFDKFTTYNLDSIYWDTFTLTPPVPANVVGVKRGTVYPDSSYWIICGHFDATAGIAHRDSARGADDDASGTAAVIEAARILKDYHFEYSIRFVALSAEELGTIGSIYYAWRASQRLDDIRGTYNYDMIGYVDVRPESIDVCGDTFCEPLVDHFIACADTYTNLLAVKKIGYVLGDEYNFQHWGYQAIGMIEDMPHVNPYYHTQADTIGAGFNDLTFCTEVTKAAVAALASSSKPLSIEENTTPSSTAFHLIPYPNPFRDHFHVKVNNVALQKNPIMFKFYDAAGRLIKAFTLSISPSQRKIDFIWPGYDNLNRKLPSGLYILMMQNGAVHEIKKLICINR